jgi:hypothetical protein
MLIVGRLVEWNLTEKYSGNEHNIGKVAKEVRLPTGLRT